MSDQKSNFRYTVRHEHRFGEDSYNFTSPILLDKYYDDQDQRVALAEVLGIDYEPHRMETLELSIFDDAIDKTMTLDEVNSILNAGQ